MLELCEQLSGLVQLDAEFNGMKGGRNVITFIIDAEKDPRMMGFSLVDAPPENFPVEADDEDVDIPHVEPEVVGAENS